MVFKVADIEALVNSFDEIFPLLDEDDFLRFAVEYLKTSLLLSGIPKRNREDQFLIESFDDRKIRKISKSDEAIALIRGLKARLSKLPELNQKYFGILIRIKETQARIQEAKNPQQRRAVAEQTLKTLQQIESEIGYRIPSHIYRQINNLSSLISARNSEEAQRVLRAFPEILEANSFFTSEIRTITEAISSALRRGNYAAAGEKANELIMAVQIYNGQNTFEPVSEALVWDMHSLKAELYHQIAVNHAILKNGVLSFEYAISAYLEAQASSSNYDREIRTLDIKADTGLTDRKIREFTQLYPEAE
jgi:hypothetical protein